MLFINSEISLMLTWLEKCSLVLDSATNQEPTFAITDTKLYVSVVILSTQDTVKFLKQLESGLKKTINWNEYHCTIGEQAQNRYLDFFN